MVNFLCHTTKGNCEYFTWDRGYAKCTHELAGQGFTERIPKMKECPLAEKVPKPPHWRQNSNQGELLESSNYHRIEGR